MMLYVQNKCRQVASDVSEQNIRCKNVIQVDVLVQASALNYRLE